MFKKWKQAHANDPDVNSTCPEGMENNKDFINSFIADGCVDYDKYGKAKKKVLFILKEPGSLRSDSQYLCNDAIENQIETHWFKHVMEAEGNFDPKYYNKFNKMCEILGVAPCETAMMNINKRGGRSKGTSDKRLAQYTKIFNSYIREEINILNPDIIVSCVGSGKAKDKLFCIPKENGWFRFPMGKRMTSRYIGSYQFEQKEIKVYGMLHPAAVGWVSNVDNYGEIFSKLIGSQK